MIIGRCCYTKDESPPLGMKIIIASVTLQDLPRPMGFLTRNLLQSNRAIASLQDVFVLSSRGGRNCRKVDILNRNCAVGYIEPDKNYDLTTDRVAYNGTMNGVIVLKCMHVIIVTGDDT